MTLHVVNLSDKLATFLDHWSPKIVADMNDHQFKLVKFQGEFVWHKHVDTDEVFIVLDGCMTVHFREGDVHIRGGELFVVPGDKEHKTSAAAGSSRMSRFDHRESWDAEYWQYRWHVVRACGYVGLNYSCGSSNPK